MTFGEIFGWRGPRPLPHQRWLARQGRTVRFVATLLMALPIFALVTYLMGDPPARHLVGIIGGSMGCALAAAWFPGSRG